VIITKDNSTPAVWAMVQASGIKDATACLMCSDLFPAADAIEVVYRRKVQGHVCSEACHQAAVKLRQR
jgi:hypothetical protein